MKDKSGIAWDRSAAAHLLSRAGFGATPEQIDAAAQRGVEEVVDEVLKSSAAPAPPSWMEPGVEEKPNYKAMKELPEEERRKKRQEQRKVYGQQQRELVGWWCNHMINTPTPHQEKLTLFWHGHFATSFRKVKVPYMMYLQNQTLRKHALGNWRELITAVSQDPAMLLYLDNTKSKASAPNENYARELMELFTLGEGHYTEEDIKESARAFTGWGLDNKTYAFRDATRGGGSNARRRLHDDGSKKFMGKRGNFDGHDIIRIILEQDQSALFMTEKLCRFFAYENPEPEWVEQLAKTFRKSDYSITALMKALFMSPQFYSKKALHTQIKSPAQWLVGSCIALGVDTPDPAFCMNATRSLGQELFAPPNVKGWDGGYAWITTSSLTQRYNLAKQLVNHRPKGGNKKQSASKKRPFTVDPLNVLPETQRNNTETAQAYLERRIYLTELDDTAQENLDAFLDTQPPAPKWTDYQIRNILHVMMSTPQYQLT